MVQLVQQFNIHDEYNKYMHTDSLQVMLGPAPLLV